MGRNLPRFKLAIVVGIEECRTSRLEAAFDRPPQGFPRVTVRATVRQVRRLEAANKNLQTPYASFFAFVRLVE